MPFDFELMLVVLIGGTGIVWAWDAWRRRRGKAATGEGQVAWWIDLSRSLFPVILAVLVIRSFLLEPFRIPSGSMIPTLYDGDFILVNKFSYGLRLPVIHTKILPLGQPERGDVVVFRYPLNPNQDYIKRIIGLPGDHVAYRDKQVYLNGKPVPLTRIGAYTGPDQDGPALQLMESLGDSEHPIVLHTEADSRGFEYVVPEGHYFVMGDNRDRSSDSRFWGPVPERNLVGKAFLVWMSWSPSAFRINWERIGDRIR